MALGGIPYFWDMKCKSLIHSLVVFLYIFAGSIHAQGIEFFHGTWEEAVMKAKAEDKLLFVDAFATWCGPCKRMAASTFPDPEVGTLFNTYFISMKIDMEQPMGIEFKRKFPVSSYPTLFFIDDQQQVIQKVVGAKTPPDLIALAEKVLAKYDKSVKYEAAYNAGDRSYQLVYDYVAALNKAGKPSLKIANDYLATQENLTSPENLKFILEAASQVDCQCFDLFEKYKSEISKVVDDETIKAKVRFACNNTVKRAIEFESPDLIPLAYDAMKRHLPAEADRFKSDSEIRYALGLHQLDQIESMVTVHAKKYIKNDPPALNRLALDLDKYGSDNVSCQKMAIDLAGKAADSKDATTPYITSYAELLFKYGQKEKAIAVIDQAMSKIEHEESKDYQTLNALRNKMVNN
jgi:thiol-disulfide isomerase/thioredoxin